MLPEAIELLRDERRRKTSDVSSPGDRSLIGKYCNARQHINILYNPEVRLAR